MHLTALAAHTLRWFIAAWHVLEWMRALLQAELGELAALLCLRNSVLGSISDGQAAAIGNHHLF